MTVDEVERRISGISCNGKGTSCGDQLAKACRQPTRHSRNNENLMPGMTGLELPARKGSLPASPESVLSSLS